MSSRPASGLGDRLLGKRGVMRVRVWTGQPGAEPAQDKAPLSAPSTGPSGRAAFLFPPGRLCLAPGQIPLEAPVPRLAAGLHSRLRRGVRPRLEGKPRTPLSSRVATRVSWSPLSGLKGKLVDFEEADYPL